MHAIGKLQSHGLKWFMRRMVRELIRPTTRLGQYFKPMSSFYYFCVSKPIHFLIASAKGQNTSSKSTLYFFYDFEVEPITYDFVWALCVANAKREEFGLLFLQVILVPGSVQGLRKETLEYEQVMSYDMRMWRVYSILLASIKLLSCSCGITLCNTREEATLILKNQAGVVYPKQYNTTFPIPYEPELAVVYRQAVMSLRADNQAKAYVTGWLKQQAGNKKVLVITLRQYAHMPERNSNLAAWGRFANYVDKERFFVVFVPDTEEALQDVPQELNGVVFFHPACWNIGLRAALYELAYLNLGVNTGPMSLCWFNARCRYITFKAIVKNRPDTLAMIKEKGFIPDSNPAFANAFQKWVWAEDDFDTIVSEFEQMCHMLA